MNEYFGYFGYGSLVNPETRSSGIGMVTARVDGWSRQWKHCVDTPFGKVCALTVAPAAKVRLDGVVVYDKLCELPALDEREIGYHRVPTKIESAQGSPLFTAIHVQMYVGNAEHQQWASEEYPIWSSYMMCVLVGYLRMFGERGLRDFIATTQGWEYPVLDDSKAPRYPRAVPLTVEEQAIIADALPELNCFAER